MRLSKHLNVLLLRLDCRRHIVELWIKHYAEVVSGRATTCTGDTLFSRFRDGFDGIRGTIDYEILVTYDWPDDDESFLSQKASEALSLVKKFLAEIEKLRGSAADGGADADAPPAAVVDVGLVLGSGRPAVATKRR